MTNEKGKKITSKNVREFLLSTGFPLEMKTAQELEKKGFIVSVSYTFFDLEENKIREIDLVATKEINGKRINLIIECKQSVRDAWIFVAPKSVPRFWNFAKHSPRIQKIEDFRKCFNDLHFFDIKIPLANNYITLDINTGKKSDHTNVTDAIYKCIKGTLHYASEMRSVSERNLYYSIICFSGNVFTTTFTSKLAVAKKTWVQFVQKFNPPAYNPMNNEEIVFQNRIIGLDEQINYDKVRQSERFNEVRNTGRSFGDDYIIDIVTPNSINELVSKIEDDARKIDDKIWPI
jgi:hypothetical protein